MRITTAHAALVALVVATSCYRMRPSSYGGRASPQYPRGIDPDRIALVPGYAIAPVGFNLTFPTGVVVDEAGRTYVVESGYSYGETFTKPRLLEVRADGNREIAVGGNNGPWNGVAYEDGVFYVAEGGELAGGRILRIDRDGKTTVLVEKLPSEGDHHTNGPAIGPDGYIYFGQGTFTNSGVIGEDDARFGWLKRHPELHDIACADVTLAGTNYESKDVVRGTEDKVKTGAFVPFGTPTERGEVIKGQVPCNGAVMRVAKTGGPPELVAWGFRNPYGIAFAPDGTLYVTDNGFDVRGSRPVWGAADHLFAIQRGGWYGWPDYSGARPVDETRFKVPGHSPIARVLAQDPAQPIKPRAYFAVHSSSNGLDFSRSQAFGFVGDAFVAQFGDMGPATGKILSPVGFRVVRVEPHSGVIHDFVSNRGGSNGPASVLKNGGIERPIAVRFSPNGDAMYVVDFGEMSVSNEGLKAVAGTGVLWKVTHSEGGGS